MWNPIAVVREGAHTSVNRSTLQRTRIVALLALVLSFCAAMVAACVEDATQVGNAPPDATTGDAPSTSDVVVDGPTTEGGVSDASDGGVDATDAGDPLCDLVEIIPDAGPDGSGDAGADASSTYVLKCGSPIKDFSVAPLGSANYPVCALTEGGDVYCWGSNLYGGVGLPVTGDGGVGNEVHTPTKILSGVTQMQAGAYGGCALKNDDSVWCWGINHTGQMGFTPASTPTTCNGNKCSTPVKVTLADGGALPPMSKVSIGEWTVCAIEKVGGKLWCWGSDGQDINFKAPSEKTGVAAPVKDVSVSIFYTHICAVAADDTVWCWGSDQSGLRGKMGFNPVGGIDATPTKVSTLTDVKQVSSGILHSCALTNADEVWCWGANGYGILGSGTTDSQSHTTPTKVPGLPKNLAWLDARGHAAFVTTKTGDVLAWGSTSNFSFGDGIVPITTCENALLCQPTVRRVGLPPMTKTGSFGGVTRDRTLIMWGPNDKGWLGHDPGTLGDLQCPGACAITSQKVSVYP